MRSIGHPLCMIGGTLALPVTALDGVVHLVPDAVIATSDTGRYAATCGAIFIPVAMTEPDGRDICPLCRARPARQGRR